eukprot:68743-Chlamydomonas_euryale.AAC.1
MVSGVCGCHVASCEDVHGVVLCGLWRGAARSGLLTRVQSTGPWPAAGAGLPLSLAWRCRWPGAVAGLALAHLGCQVSEQRGCSAAPHLHVKAEHKRSLLRRDVCSVDNRQRVVH